ncbi:uncharacterized protein LOC135322362 [Camelus dromedarius]|uniref:uncharacterized protein LOC135322362 n=1 Tax=Camelus dromedarius TaxID=9838 RepID=UPI003119D515
MAALANEYRLEKAAPDGSREGDKSGKDLNHLSPALSTTSSRLGNYESRSFLSPSRPPSHLEQTQEQEQASQTHAARPQPPPRQETWAASRPHRDSLEPWPPPPPPAPGARLARGSLPLTPLSPSPATSGRLTFSPDSRPSRAPVPPPEEQKEGSAGSLPGRRGVGGADSSAAAPHTKGLRAPGAASARSSPLRERGQREGLQEPSWTGRDGGEGGSAAAGPGSESKWTGEGGGPVADGGAGRETGAPAWLRRPARAAPCAPDSARPARSAAGGRGAGRGWGGAGERGGGLDPGLQPAPETRRGPPDPQEVCNGTSHDALRDHGSRCPEEVWTDPLATHTGARARSPQPFLPDAPGPRSPLPLGTPPKRQESTLQDTPFVRCGTPVLTH